MVLGLLVSAHTASKCPLCSLFSSTFLTFLCLLAIISPFKMVLKPSAEVLSGVPKHKKAEMCLTEKIHVLGKLGSGMSHSAVGCDFSVHESSIYTKKGICKQKRT